MPYYIDKQMKLNLTSQPSRSMFSIKGNVYIGERPVCDDGWGDEEARVACRYKDHILCKVQVCEGLGVCEC